MRALMLLSLLALVGCSDTFEKQSSISKLRILAVQAEPAELIIEDGQPPPKTTLTALAIDPRSSVVQLRWALCTTQGVVPPPTLQCPGAEGVDLFSTSGAAHLDLGADPFRAAYEQLILNPQVQPLLSNGVPVIVGLSATSTVSELDALTTITLRNAGAPINHNPAIATLMADDEAIADDGTTPVKIGATVRLLPIPAEGAHEVTSDGSLEKLNYSFYSDSGEIQSLRSTDTTATGEPADPGIDWIAPATAGPARIWVVVRDGRGGVGWVAKQVAVH